MRFHLIGLPHTETVDAVEWSWCAYTGKVRKFAQMMADGHEVFLYSGQQCDVPVTEHIPCFVTPAEGIPSSADHPAWIAHNAVTIHEIRKRIQPGDFVLSIFGSCQAALKDAFPANPVVEFGIGYGGTFADFRVFESRSHQHLIYGQQQGDNADGRFYDTVIPNYFDASQFEVGKPKGYFLYVGRIVERKGYNIASMAAEALKVPLKIAGSGPDPLPGWGEAVGAVGSAERKELMSGAIATFVPSQYVEPFGGVAVESLLSGTPVITTDFGAFTEYVHPRDGWRCSTLQEFVDAGKAALSTNGRADRRKRAVERFSLEAIRPQYERYFGRVADLYNGKDWAHIGD